ncbi:hypothetical protein K443DRAFT_389868 [Laccaria amethystina LaAM-08-1]|uniref:Uncharacterized protein n=1 Tax=Laccaria amethystina LaAM-08-1 TaxID=1095629 RepID=A0A0C9YNK3_9AGAR|nr:hypothetical protein K443DRAFT_389868 [Laccaria amethystina LaAM-08-1]
MCGRDWQQLPQSNILQHFRVVNALRFPLLYPPLGITSSGFDANDSCSMAFDSRVNRHGLRTPSRIRRPSHFHHS